MAKRPIHEEAPLSLNWHLTSECTTDCKYCYLGRRHVKAMSRDILFERLEEAIRIGVCSIDVAGGDIICSPYLFDVLSILKHNQLLPIMLSSKTFVSKEMATSLASVRESILEFQFSIDSDDEQIASYLMGVSGFPDKIFESIINVVEVGIPVTAKIVITPYNILTAPRLYRKLKHMGVNRIRLALYSRSGFHHTDDLFNHKESCDWLSKEVEKLRAEFPDESIFVQNGQPSLEPLSIEARKSSWKERSSCPAGRSSMMICSDGKVIPCEQMPETEEYFCGDLTTQSIMEVWDGERLKEMTYGMPREKFHGLPCYDCEEQDECLNVMGTCIRDLAAHWGNIYQPPTNCYRYDLPFVRHT
jgi:radical SAM protein with 4Fe4S-binding SPASM domain